MEQTKTALTNVEILYMALIKYSAALAESLGLLNDFLAFFYDEGKIKGYYKGLKSLFILKNMIDECKKDYVQYLSNFENNVNKIELVNSQLAQEIRGMGLKSDVETSALVEISRILFNVINDGEFEIKYISTHIEEILGLVEKITDRKLAGILRNYFIVVSGHETDYLLKYTEEVRNWNQKVITMPLTYFFSVASAFIFGDKRLGYLGLLYYFRDEVVAKRFYQKSNIRQLLNFVRERKYLASIRDEIKSGLEQGRWEDFYKFWNHIEEIIKDLEETYGSVRFGEEIRKRKDEFGESPAQWLNLFNSIFNEVYNPDFVRKVVIEPAASEIVQIFSERFDELNANKAKMIGQSKRIMEIITKQVKRIALHNLARIHSEWEKTQKDKIEAIRASLSASLFRYVQTSNAIQTDAQSFIAFLRNCGEVAQMIEYDESTRAKLVDKLPKYKFTRLNFKGIMRFVGPISNLFNRVLWSAFVNKNLLDQLGEYSQPYLNSGLRTVVVMRNLNISITNHIRQMREMLKNELEEGFWQEVLRMSANRAIMEGGETKNG